MVSGFFVLYTKKIRCRPPSACEKMRFYSSSHPIPGVVQVFSSATGVEVAISEACQKYLSREGKRRVRKLLDQVISKSRFGRGSRKISTTLLTGNSPITWLLSVPPYINPSDRGRREARRANTGVFRYFEANPAYKIVILKNLDIQGDTNNSCKVLPSLSTFKRYRKSNLFFI